MHVNMLGEHVDVHVNMLMRMLVRGSSNGSSFFIALVRTRVLPVVMYTGASSNVHWSSIFV